MGKSGGENDPTMPPEERILERLTHERRKMPMVAVFSLHDEENLAYNGRSLSKFDDFDGGALVTKTRRIKV